jgi:hypothetical protein
MCTIRREIVEEHQEEAAHGSMPFCYDYLKGIKIGKVYLISGNHSNFKRASKLRKFLFDFDNRQLHKH